MPVTRRQAAGVEPPKPLPKRERKPKKDPRTFKEISADLTTAQDARNRTINAPAQGALPNNAPDINSTNESPAMPDAAPASVKAPKLRPWEKTVEVVIERPKPRPLHKTGAASGRKAGQDADADPFDLSARRTRGGYSQNTVGVDSPAEEIEVPATLYDEDLEEFVRPKEYEFEDITAMDYLESDEDEELQRFDGYSSPSSPAARRRHSAEPRSRSRSADSAEREDQRPSSVDSPVRCALPAGSHMQRGSSAPHHSLTVPRGRSAEGGSRSPSAGSSHSQARSHSADPRAPSPSERPRRTPAPYVDAEFTPTRGRCPTCRSPLPPSSPPLVVESEFDDSEDDYGRQEEEREKERLKALAKGGRVPPSLEDDDDEDEEEFEAEVAQNGLDEETTPTKKAKKSRSKSKSKKSAPAAPSKAAKGKKKANEGATATRDGAPAVSRPSKSVKGKGKAKKGAVAEGRTPDAAATDDDDDEEDDDEGSSSKRSGQIPEAIRERLFKLDADFKDAVVALAAESGKAPKTLFELLGVYQKTTRATSAWNVFQSWYSQKHGNPDNRNGRPCIHDVVKAAFMTTCGPDAEAEGKSNNSARVFERIPWLLKWHEDVTTQAVIQFRGRGKVKRKVQKELEPVVNIAQRLLETYNVHMLGAIVDIDGEASCFFGAGDAYKEYRSVHQVSLDRQMKDMQHQFGVMDIRRRGVEAHMEVPLLTGNLDAREKERARDTHRRQFSSIMGAMLYRHCLAAGVISDEVDSNKFQMKWGVNFLDIAFESRCRIINYPSALEDVNLIIGTGNFALKTIKEETFKKFLLALLKSAGARGNAEKDDNDDGAAPVDIVAWDEDELALPLEEQRTIPLVLSVGGVGLRCVKHSPAYDKEMKKKQEKADRAAAKQEKRAKKLREAERRCTRSASVDELHHRLEYSPRRDPSPRSRPQPPRNDIDEYNGRRRDHEKSGRGLPLFPAAPLPAVLSRLAGRRTTTRTAAAVTTIRITRSPGVVTPAPLFPAAPLPAALRPLAAITTTTSATTVTATTSMTTRKLDAQVQWVALSPPTGRHRIPAAKAAMWGVESPEARCSGLPPSGCSTPAGTQRLGDTSIPASTSPEAARKP
ncbi:hypothetical protein B0H13DRAFT_2313935 [Mycena leptocephala]|nr:hypothetical protein B0H13DRAFT_2313935 [Mycena leptocephala]